MARNQRTAVVVASVVTVLLVDISRASPSCDYFGDACLKGNRSFSAGIYLGITADVDAEQCGKFCASHVSCKSWTYSTLSKECAGSDELEPPAGYEAAHGFVSSARWSCREADDTTHPRVWFNGDMGSIVFVRQEGCNLTIANTRNLSNVSRAEAKLGELDMQGIVANVLLRDSRTQLPKVLTWQPHPKDVQHGTEVADCPGEGWEFHTIPATEPREWWDVKESVDKATMVDNSCTMTIQSKAEEDAGDSPTYFIFHAPREVDQSGYIPRLYLQSGTMESPVALLGMEDASTVYVYMLNPASWDKTNIWAAYYGESSTPLAMPLCFNLKDHKPEFPSCDVDDDNVDQTSCEAKGCKWEVSEDHCACHDRSSCEGLGGKWEEQFCKAQALGAQQWFRINPWAAAEHHFIDNGDEVTGLYDRCADQTSPWMKDYFDGLAKACCHQMSSICDGRPRSKCVQVPGDKRMRLTARGYKLIECNSEERNRGTNNRSKID